MEANTQDSIKVSYTNTISDHIHACRLYYAAGILAKVDKIVALALLCFGSWLIFSIGITWWGLIWFILAPLEWFNLLSFQPLQIYILFKSNPKYQQPYDLTFSDAGIDFQTPIIDSHIEWTHYNAMLESDRILLLIYGKRAYSVIPKSAFASGDQVEKFRRLVESHLH